MNTCIDSNILDDKLINNHQQQQLMKRIVTVVDDVLRVLNHELTGKTTTVATTKQQQHHLDHEENDNSNNSSFGQEKEENNMYDEVEEGEEEYAAETCSNDIDILIKILRELYFLETGTTGSSIGNDTTITCIDKIAGTNNDHRNENSSSSNGVYDNYHQQQNTDEENLWSEYLKELKDFMKARKKCSIEDSYKKDSASFAQNHYTFKDYMVRMKFGQEDRTSKFTKTLVLVLCLLVCCDTMKGIETTATTIPTSASSVHSMTVHRPKRWQSMALETIRTFQQKLNEVLAANRYGKTDSSLGKVQPLVPLILLARVWSNYIIPAVTHVQQILINSTNYNYNKQEQQLQSHQLAQEQLQKHKFQSTLQPIVVQATVSQSAIITDSVFVAAIAHCTSNITCAILRELLWLESLAEREVEPPTAMTTTMIITNSTPTNGGMVDNSNVHGSNTPNNNPTTSVVLEEPFIRKFLSKCSCYIDEGVYNHVYRKHTISSSVRKQKLYWKRRSSEEETHNQLHQDRFQQQQPTKEAVLAMISTIEDNLDENEDMEDIINDGLDPSIRQDLQPQNNTIQYWMDEVGVYQDDAYYNPILRWSDSAIALVVYFVGWNTFRSYVWSVNYTWRLYFPYIPILLLRHEEAQQEEEYEVEEQHQQQKQVEAFMFGYCGYSLLRQLLLTTPKESITIGPTNVSPQNNDAANGSSTNTFHHPLNPIAVGQLLINRIVSQASLTASLSSSSNHSTKNNSSSSRKTTIPHDGNYNDQSLLPTSIQAYEMLYELIQKYKSRLYQFQIIKALIMTCPHFGIRPKLVDLYRLFVHWDEEDTNIDNGTTEFESKSRTATQSVWNMIEWYIVNLEEEHVTISSRRHPNSQQTNNDSISGDETGVEVKIYQLKNIDTLISDCETYCAILGIIQRWLIQNNNTKKTIMETSITINDASHNSVSTKDYPNILSSERTATTTEKTASTTSILAELKQRIVHIGKALDFQFTRWSTTGIFTGTTSTTLPTDHHRLFLLQSSLQQTLNYY